MIGHSSLSETIGGALRRALPTMTLLEMMMMTARPRAGATSYVPELFTSQASRTPHAVALQWEGGELTYEDLDAATARLAHRLLRNLAHGGRPVAVCLERSPRMIVALLGILRAGAAYVPLDPEYPAARLSLCLDDAGPQLLLTERHLAPLFSGYPGELLFIEDVESGGREAGSPTAAADVDQNPGTGTVRGTDLAYVIHTSGSTGRPKGVMITHASLANHAFAVNQLFGFGPGDRVLLCRSLSFDASVEEIFPPLLNGATLIVAGDPLRQTFRALTQQLVTTRTTFLSVPTAFWHSWVEESDCLSRLAGESSLRLVIVAGEQARRGALSAWKKGVGDRIRWCNVYGPTEGTVTSTVYEPAPGWESDDFTTVPIGYPISNVQAHVLDGNMSPVPGGADGELYIGGAGVAAGYLNAPELTSQRFVPDPFSTLPGARLYRTGDLVRRGPAGCLEFLGRRDDQMKIRGYRIEPGEVEAATAAHPSVRACAVVDRTDDLGDMRLACFVVADAPESFAVDDLRSHLRRELPWYMVPSSITVVPALPMTPNRKIDRAALRVIPVTEPLREHVAPRTSTEKILAEIWEETLQQKDVSVLDDFFEIGGHSLVAATIISRVRSALGLDLPVREFFAAPTIEGLAGVVVRRQATRQAAAS